MKSYGTDGGRIVFEVGKDWAKLVSAAPAPNWSMQVWTDSTWIRVDFGQDGGRVVSVFCTWNDCPPQVEVVQLSLLRCCGRIGSPCPGSVCLALRERSQCCDHHDEGTRRDRGGAG
ncbi:hypothetical protein GCM10010207_07090 [Streptomyces atratus]|nr:hypothetical protein GCM10010207_07090 [Streptomyces atratus]